MVDRISAWSNPSVLEFAGGTDPLLKAREVAAHLVVAAQAHNLQGPPIDVLALARAAGIHVRAVNEVADARIAPSVSGDRTETPRPADDFASVLEGTSGLTIDYNPSRPKGRLRFSIAHELAHACFPGVGEQVRHRTGSGAVSDADDGDNWELELLCNVIASELLLPDDAVAGLLDIATDIDFIMETRRRWDVSIEALLRRLTRASKRALTMVAVSRVGRDGEKVPRLDYADHSDATPPDSALRSLAHGQLLPAGSMLLDCVAVGQTVRGEIEIDGTTFAAQAVGAPPYPGARFPRVLALLEEPDRHEAHPGIDYVTGDLLDLDEDAGAVVIAHVVSDASRVWGRMNVGATLSRAFPDAARAFRAWSIADAEHLRLGRVHVLDQLLDGREVTVASMVAQAGFGPGEAVRLRYDALAECLDRVADLAAARGARVHVPRIGAGQAGGRWDVIAELINTCLVGRSVAVTVHTKPAARINPDRAR